MLNTSAIKTFLHRELIISRDCLIELLNPVIFFMIAIVSFKLALGPFEISPNINFAIVLVTLFFSSSLLSINIYQADYTSGFIEQTAIANQGFGYITAKWLFNALLQLFNALISGILAVLLFDIDLHSVLILLVIVPPLILLINFANLITIHSNNSFLGFIILAPMSMPLLILAHLAFDDMIFAWLIVAEFLFLFPIILFAKKSMI